VLTISQKRFFVSSDISQCPVWFERLYVEPKRNRAWTEFDHSEIYSKQCNLYWLSV